MDKMINDKNAFDFKDPVDYEALGLLDYSTIIKHPMDLTKNFILLINHYRIIF